MNKYTYKALLVCMVLYSPMSLSEDTAIDAGPKVLIWDLGGVLATYSVFDYMSFIGLKDILLHMIMDMKLPWNYSSFRDRPLDILRRMDIKKEKSFDEACTDTGLDMPYVMRAHQTGFLGPDIILPLIDDTCERLWNESYFESIWERRVLQRTLQEMFSPSTNAYCTHLSYQGLELVKHLAAQYDKNGAKKYKLFLLSNWDSWSFQLLRKKFEQLFSCFDDIFVSGEIGVMKPMREAFDAVIKKHSLQKEDCIFIDDQQENITAAQSFGITNALLFKNYDDLRPELQKLGIGVG